MLAIDVSRSMTAQDVQPTRLDAARDAPREAFLDKVPKEYSIAVVGFGTRAFVALPPTTDRVLAHDALASLAPSEGTAIGDAIALADEARHSGSGRATASCRRRRCSSSPTARATAASTAPLAAARQARRRAHPGVDRARRHARTASSRTSSSAATRSRSACRRARARCSRSRSVSGGQFFRARTSAALTSVYKKLATRIGHRTQNRQITDLFAGGAIVLLLARRRPLGVLVPEAVP